MNSTAMKCVVTITSLGHITMSIYIPSLHNLSIIVRIDVCSNDDKKFRQISVVSVQIAPLIILVPGGLRPGGLRPGGLRPGGLRPGGIEPTWLRPRWTEATGKKMC